MFTRRVSAVSSTNTPAVVVSVTRPRQALNRAGAPGPLPPRRVLATWIVAPSFAGTAAGVTVVGRLSRNPTSEGNPGEATMLMAVVADVMVTASLPGLLDSTRIVNGSGRSTEPSGQSSAGVP